MLIAFTICSNNYLAQAKTLGDSLAKTNPEYAFYIFLVDKFSDKIDYDFFSPFKVILIETVRIDDFNGMFLKYNITELNTAVKPFIFKYLFNEFEELKSIIYLDPDIIVYNEFIYLNQVLQECNIVLTPHFLTPIYDNLRPGEPDILNSGLYNLGFLAVSKSEETNNFLNWWSIKLKDQCFINFAEGLFVDQLWINFVPLYFKNVFVLKDVGYNMAYWNLHERALEKLDGEYLVNSTHSLVFFHYSGFSISKPDILSKHQNRFDFHNRVDVLPLFENYSDALVKNKHLEFSRVDSYYSLEKKKIDDEEFRKEQVNF